MRRIANRVRCSAGDTENQNLVRWMPSLASMSSNIGACRMNSAYCSGVQNPITFSTPARLYHDLSNSTISVMSCRSPEGAKSHPCSRMRAARR